MVPWWGMLLLAVGLIVVFLVLLVLGYRRYSRVSRNEANLRISRDRANVDLQMMSHQVQVRVQVQFDATGSPATGAAARRAAPRLRKLDGTGGAADAGGVAAAAGAEEPIPEPLS